MGHSKAVHDVQFDNSGAQFLSSSFDRQMKLWDTETGKLLSLFRRKKDLFLKLIYIFSFSFHQSCRSM